MKIKINRNIFWTDIFVKRLSSLGLRNVCISPGSRSTPLTLAFAGEKKIKKYVHIDERSSAFFALGLAKATGMPTALVCTSGTAAAEFYPAVIEAFQQRVPLIICTADRPPGQRGRGANQTINQENLYKNHIRMFIDAGLPSADAEGAQSISSVAAQAFYSAINQSGPVHINFPFRKPFEPDSFTDEIEADLLSLPEESLPLPESLPDTDKMFNDLIELIKNSEKILFITGPDNYSPEFKIYVKALAEMTGSPLFADAFSHLRFGRSGMNNIISSYDAMLRSVRFTEKAQPELIIQFGRTPTSKALLNYLASVRAPKILINKYGEMFDPSGTAASVLPMDPASFCRKALRLLADKDYDSDWLQYFVNQETKIGRFRDLTFNKAPLQIESKLIREVVEALPSGTGLMVSNSSPIREVDNFLSPVDKELKLFFNRGASGIDGIISTALGICSGLRKPAALITGDLAFFYDLNSLLAGRQYRIPLTIILINNNGGGIFNHLPVSRYRKFFRKYFITPHNLEFGVLVKSFGWKHKTIRTSAGLRSTLQHSIASKSSTVLEIRTDAAESLKLRNKFWKQASKLINE